MKPPKSFVPDSFIPEDDITSKKPPLFKGRAIERMQGETAYTQELINHATAPVIALRNASDAIAALDHKIEADAATHQNLVVQNKTATAMRVDPATSNAIRLEEERSRIKLSETRKAAVIEVLKNKHMERNRLEAYKTEVAIDLQAYLSSKLISHETVLGINTRLRALIEEREDIEKLRVSFETKQRLLAQQDEVIAVFQENLRVEMARHLLPSGPSDNVEGNRPKTDGKADD